jgi:hypothetical protein
MRCKVGNLEGDTLELADRLSECLALAGIAEDEVDGFLRQAEPAVGDKDASVHQRGF